MRCIVASAPVARWAATSAATSRSVRTSPLATTNVSSMPPCGRRSGSLRPCRAARARWRSPARPRRTGHRGRPRRTGPGRKPSANVTPSTPPRLEPARSGARSAGRGRPAASTSGPCRSAAGAGCRTRRRGRRRASGQPVLVVVAAAVVAVARRRTRRGRPRVRRRGVRRRSRRPVDSGVEANRRRGTVDTAGLGAPWSMAPSAGRSAAHGGMVGVGVLGLEGDGEDETVLVERDVVEVRHVASCRVRCPGSCPRR